ncbi:MAG TPA: zf-HC2 domain-containing protein [Gemmatimonadaceae bacterium]
MTFPLHPTFDALSAFADAASDDVSQARVQRHVRECDACRATVAEIRAMGDAVRAMPLREAPSDLWARVAARRADDTEVATLAPTIGDSRASGAPADLPSTPGTPAAGPDAARGLATPRGKSIVFGATLVVLALATSMMLLSRTPLEATGLSRLAVSPARPAAGGTLIVRYSPAPYFRREPRLVLIGRVARRGERREAARYPAFDADSLATLLPQRDGAFVARLTLPADFRWAQLAVVDSTGDRMDRDGSALWTVVGGNADRSPSLEALMSAEEDRSPWIGTFDNHLVAGPRWSIADTIQRYFPGHPAGWAYYTRYGVRRGLFDFLRFFETAERKYASLDGSLWPERTLDADREHAMLVFAHRIEEPLDAAKWANRIAREHPDDRRAFDDLFGAIRHMQLNSTAGLADSMHAWLPLLIDISRRNASSLPVGGSTDNFAGRSRAEVIASLAQEFGDSTMKAAWPIARPAHDFIVPGTLPRSMSLDEERQARAQIADPCGRPAGRFSLSPGTTWVVQFCELVKSNLLASLSRLEAERGHASLALTLADSALRTTRPQWACVTSDAHRARARALLMLGDSSRAVLDLAVATGQSLAPPREADSLLATLGTASVRARFAAVADSARHAVQQCAQDRRQRNAAHADSARLGVR